MNNPKINSRVIDTPDEIIITSSDGYKIKIQKGVNNEMLYVKCKTCGKRATDMFVNPFNPSDRGNYCPEHYRAIKESFGVFLELMDIINIQKSSDKSVKE